MLITPLGTLLYRDAWDHQVSAHQRVVEGEAERLLLVEHPPVITLGRRPGVARHILASESSLRQMGVEVVQSDRGGDITFHGPGQLVAYPIVRLIDHRLSVGSFVRRLEQVVIDTLGELGVVARRDPSAVGVWVERDGALAKICALGVRIRRGVSMHGIALNITTDLRYFDLIVPCGLAGRPVTSLAQLLGERCPTWEQVSAALIDQMQRAFPAAPVADLPTDSAAAQMSAGDLAENQ